MSTSQKVNYKWGLGVSYYMISFCERSRGEYDHALVDDSTAQKILEETGDRKNVGRFMFLQAYV